MADPAQRGEFVIVTGPSRTADIEKILILGVHGPKRLVVILVDKHDPPVSRRENGCDVPRLPWA